MPAKHQTTVLPTHTPALFDAAVREAVNLLREGEAVALPTETVYGLAVNACNPAAVRDLFHIKGRPVHNPIIVHVADLDMAHRCVAAWSNTAQSLARAFWPGPLTLVLPKHPDLPPEVTAGGGTVGVRWPAHPLIQAVIRACGFPLAAPSANLSTQTSPTRVEHVLRSLSGRIPLILDGGPCNVGIESTVLDLTGMTPQILRPGMIHEEALMAVLGPVRSAEALCESSSTHQLRSPGLLARHYAPRTPLRILTWASEQDLEAQIRQFRTKTDTPVPVTTSPEPRVCVIAHTVIPSSSVYARVSVVPHEPEAYARALYAELHACDDLQSSWIVLEAVPDRPEWLGIADRLRRAAG